MFQTPMNQASSRSHCIFTIHIVSRETGSATIRRSKLHLVDLAGYVPDIESSSPSPYSVDLSFIHWKTE